MLRDHDGKVDLDRQVSEQPADCIETAPRGTDADQLVRGYFTFL
jgi:hypothetical protein